MQYPIVRKERKREETGSLTLVASSEGHRSRSRSRRRRRRGGVFFPWTRHELGRAVIARTLAARHLGWNASTPTTPWPRAECRVHAGDMPKQNGIPPAEGDTMLLGEERHTAHRPTSGGGGCCPTSASSATSAAVAAAAAALLPLHLDEHTAGRLRLPSVNGGLLMDLPRKPRNCRDNHWISLEPLPTRLQAIRCTVPGCVCDCFAPGKRIIRSCDTCKHGWVAHAMDKLGFRHLFNCNQVEIVQSNLVFDIASLMLYGCQATPIRLKILLDRLFSVLQHEEVLQVLHGFGWKYEDYARGYILQDSQGNVLDRWNIATREEEPQILQQFLRFGETKAITQQILLQESSERPNCIVQPTTRDSDIKKFIERTNRAITSTPTLKISGEGFFGSIIKSNSQPPLPPPVPQPVSTPASATATCTTVSSTSLQHPPPLLPSSSVGNAPNCTASSSTPVITSKNLIRHPMLPTSGVTPSAVTLTSTPLPHNLSPNGSSQHSFDSSINCTSPMSMSPLNRLQNMQPYDYRRERVSPDSRPLHETVPSSSLNHSILSVTSPSTTFPPQTTALALVNSSSNSLLANSDLSGTDGGSDDDNSNMALNLSRTGPTLIDSVYATKKVKHLRKSANPMKRRWNPGMLSTIVSNSGSGKKRVQCNVCLKTFCDKGALKIHFSAVHLREMHKCTVEGCNMMFSSRRSRNRHSANPNPKLHTPHLRRKISPHDGRTANPSPVILPGGMIPGLGGPLALSDVMHPLNAVGHMALSPSENNHEKRLSLPNHMDICPSFPSRSLPSLSSPLHEHSFFRNVHEDNSMNPFRKRPRFSDGDEGEDASNEEEDDLPKNLSAKDDVNLAAKGVRKRKSMNPTRCAITDDGDIQYVSSDVDDDSSSDTYLHGDSMENGTEKSDDFKDDDDKDLDDDKSSDSLGEIKKSVTPLIPVDKIKREKQESGVIAESGSAGGNEGNDDENDAERISNQGEAVSSSSFDESSENALKHLESLSQGNFGDLLPHNARSLLGQPSLLPNALALPLVGMGLPGGGYHHRDMSPNLGEGILVPHQGGRSSPSSPLSESQPLPGLPPFRDASIVGSVEIPVDKDNPRRCIACGKIFQNHFGVKTHYQNVHLKLMHKCTVEGCNAAFPSKRSRDRHSANLNLHRKLLSTSDKAFLEKGSPFAAALAGQTLRDEFLARIYGEPPVLPLGLDPYAAAAKLPVSFAETLLNNNNHERALHANHLGALAPHLLPGLLIPPPTMHSSDHDLGHMETPVSSATSSPHDLHDRHTPHTPHTPHASHTPTSTPSTPTMNVPFSLTYGIEDDPPSPEADGSVSCKFCQKKFSEIALLKEHYETLHVPEMYRCTVEGCNKIFTSLKKRNAHSQNEAIHKHLTTAESAS